MNFSPLVFPLDMGMGMGIGMDIGMTPASVCTQWFLAVNKWGL